MEITFTYILFSFKCLTSDFFELFLFCSRIWIRMRTFFSDSDPAKSSGFCRLRIRIHNTEMMCIQGGGDQQSEEASGEVWHRLGPADRHSQGDDFTHVID
jgi:hypothetical protein